ncbi:MAG: efflux RND transporter permease subunit [Myxococcota bacterium]
MDPATFAVRNWQFSSLMLLLLVAIGLQSWFTIPRSEDPAFQAPTFAVVAVLPGSPPTEVEALVAKPLEDRIRAMSDLDRVRVTVEDGLAVFNVEFDLDTDPEERHAALLRELDGARPELPSDLDRIEVRPLRPSEVNVLQYAVVSDTASLDAMRAAAEALEDAAETIDGVRDADIVALPDQRIDVAVDPDALAAIGLPVGAVLQALGSNDARIPGGHVELGQRRLSVTPDTAWTTEAAITETPVASLPQGLVRIGDLAQVERRHGRAQHAARFDGRRALWVAVSFEDGANVFATRDGVDAAMRAVALPDAIELQLGFDQSANVAHRLSGFGRDFAIAIGLVLLTLLPLGFRASTVVMVSIPLALATGLSLLHAAGYGINQLSIVGFVISLGLLVDDAIVVVENVARHLRQGKPPVQAAIDGTREISLAVVGCTVTLLFAFLPLLFLPGTAGMFIRSLPLAVVFTVAASLVISLTLVPLMASRWLLPEDEHGNWFLQLVQRGIELSYGRALERAIARPVRTLVAAGVFVAACVALVPVVGFSLFPKAGIPQFRVEIDAGDGAALATTDAAVRFVEQELARHPEIAAVMANTGAGNPRIYYNVVSKAERASVGEVFVRLHEVDRRTPALLDGLQQTFDVYPGARISVREFENGPPVDAPVAVRLVGDDLDALRAASAEVDRVMRGVTGLVSVDDPLAVPRTDLALAVDREAAAELGVPVAEVARAARFALAGLEVGRFRDRDGDELPLVVRASGEGEPDLARVRSLTVATMGGGTVPLGDLAALELRSGPARITRQDGRRAVTVGAQVGRGYNTHALAGEVRDALATASLPPGIGWEMAGEAESQQESFGGIGTAALVAAFGILAVLVLEFRTFRGTLVVASVIPLGVAGGVLALLFTGNTLSFTATIGFVALIGIEVKNSILLVDFANQQRAAGASLDEAIAKAGEVRFLPVLLTTATAMGGLVPLAVEGSALYSPLAYVIMGGLLSSTLLARIVTPAAYKLLAPPLEGAPA